MAESRSDTVFTGSIPELYDEHLVPLIFEPYAGDLARAGRGAPRRRACWRSPPAPAW